MKAIGIMREVGISTRIIDLKPYKDPDEFIHNSWKRSNLKDGLRDDGDGNCI